MDELTRLESDATGITEITFRRITSCRDEGELRAMRFAMHLSLAFGVLILVQPSSREEFCECFASTGGYAPETTFPNPNIPL